MIIDLKAAARAIPLTALILASCVSEKTYESQTQQLQAARAQAGAEQAQIAKMQAENKWVVAGDVLFPEGDYQVGPAGQAALSQYVPRLQNLQNAKVVVYGYTDNLASRTGIAAGGHQGQHRSVVKAGRCRGGVFPRARGQPKHSLGQGVRRHASGRRERHARQPGEEPPHRDRAGGPRRLTWKERKRHFVIPAKGGNPGPRGSSVCP
jgi:hypothetical protein